MTGSTAIESPIRSNSGIVDESSNPNAKTPFQRHVTDLYYALLVQAAIIPESSGSIDRGFRAAKNISSTQFYLFQPFIVANAGADWYLRFNLR